MQALEGQRFISNLGLDPKEMIVQNRKPTKNHAGDAENP